MLLCANLDEQALIPPSIVVIAAVIVVASVADTVVVFASPCVQTAFICTYAWILYITYHVPNFSVTPIRGMIQSRAHHRMVG